MKIKGLKAVTGIIAAGLVSAMCLTTVFAANVTVTYITPGRVTTRVCPQGSNMTYAGPQDINIDGYAFCGWNVPLANVQTNTVATGVYMPIGNESQAVEACNVYHHLPTGVLSYTTATPDIIPEATRKLKVPPTPMATPCTLTANETIAMNPVGIPGKTCVVKWYNGSNGELWKADVVWYGTTLPDPAKPCMAGYEFVGWWGSWTNITEDREIMACYYTGTRAYYSILLHNELYGLGDSWVRSTDSLVEEAKKRAGDFSDTRYWLGWTDKEKGETAVVGLPGWN